MLFWTTAASAFASVGFQTVQVPDPPGKPLAVAIWYPSSGASTLQPIQLFRQDVTQNGAIAGSRLGVIFLSHGNGGSLASHYDTANALARAGFIAVALTHTGDNSQDQSYVANGMNLIDRPRQFERVIRYILDEWPERSHIDPHRIGVFGFSLGGYTALVEIGGVPDLGRTAQLCRERPKAPECDFVRQNQGDPLAPAPRHIPAWVHDSRIRAAVVAAPAVGYMFGSDGLKQVRIPVQLWRATNDTQAPDAWNSAVVNAGLANPPEVHVIPNADHYSFLPPCSDALKRVASFICGDAPGFDRAAFHDKFNQEVTAFFHRVLTAR